MCFFDGSGKLSGDYGACQELFDVYYTRRTGGHAVHAPVTFVTCLCYWYYYLHHRSLFCHRCHLCFGLPDAVPAQLMAQTIGMTPSIHEGVPKRFPCVFPVTLGTKYARQVSGVQRRKMPKGPISHSIVFPRSEDRRIMFRLECVR